MAEAAEVSSAFTALLPPPSWSQARARGGLAIVTWMLRVLAVNPGKERNTQRPALPKGGGGRTARRKANESFILPERKELLQRHAERGKRHYPLINFKGKMRISPKSLPQWQTAEMM